MIQPSKLEKHICIKNKQPEKWDLKWRAGYRIIKIERDGRYIHIENQVRGKIHSCNMKDIMHEPPIIWWDMPEDKFG